MHRTLKEQRLHTYHVQKLQADFPRRVIYCGRLLQQCRERPNSSNCILFTDEAGFTRNAVFNSHNIHIWSDKNPHARQEVRFQRLFFINVWAGTDYKQITDKQTDRLQTD